MTSRVIYKGHLRTEATHLRSGNVILTDAPVDNKGKGEAFSPTDLTATSLASCILTIMGIAAQEHEIDMEGTVAEVKKNMVNGPRRIESIEIQITMPQKQYSSKQIKILEKAAHHCPVALSLNENTKELLSIIWPEN